MIDLNKEAEEYVNKIDRSEDGLVEQCFIAGANSKSVKQRIIQAQINILGVIYSDNKCSDFNSSTFQDVEFEMEKLQKQLKELEDE